MIEPHFGLVFGCTMDLRSGHTSLIKMANQNAGEFKGLPLENIRCKIILIFCGKMMSKKNLQKHIDSQHSSNMKCVTRECHHRGSCIDQDNGLYLKVIICQVFSIQ